MRSVENRRPIYPKQQWHPIMKEALKWARHGIAVFLVSQGLHVSAQQASQPSQVRYEIENVGTDSIQKTPTEEVLDMLKTFGVGDPVNMDIPYTVKKNNATIRYNIVINGSTEDAMVIVHREVEDSSGVKQFEPKDFDDLPDEMAKRFTQVIQNTLTQKADDKIRTIFFSILNQTQNFHTTIKVHGDDNTLYTLNTAISSGRYAISVTKKDIQTGKEELINLPNIPREVLQKMTDELHNKVQTKELEKMTPNNGIRNPTIMG